eukprot:scaffold1822_cov221-Alexandrium_tamarense.AAC.5
MTVLIVAAVGRSVAVGWLTCGLTVHETTTDRRSLSRVVLSCICRGEELHRWQAMSSVQEYEHLFANGSSFVRRLLADSLLLQVTRETMS